MDDTFANREMVLYALYILGGATKKCHTEDIAFKCFQLWPTVFSWTKYSQYPDKEIVRFGLTDSRTPRPSHNSRSFLFPARMASPGKGRLETCPYGSASFLLRCTLSGAPRNVESLD